MKPWNYENLLSVCELMPQINIAIITREYVKANFITFHMKHENFVIFNRIYNFNN